MSNAKPSVLIVDEMEETREVLRTALERLGMQIWSASKPAQGMQMARQHRPDVVVLDLEAADEDPRRLSEDFQAQTGTPRTRMVMLGTAKRVVPGGGEFVAKPYHYAVLIRKIEQVLERRHPPRVANVRLERGVRDACETG